MRDGHKQWRYPLVCDRMGATLIDFSNLYLTLV
jgi:hypothetical protein